MLLPIIESYIHHKRNPSKDTKNLLFPHRWELLCFLVIAGKTMDSALDQDQPEFGILVFPVPLEMLSDGNGFLNQMVQILGDFRSKS